MREVSLLDGVVHIGTAYQVTGFTYEDRLKKGDSGEWIKEWEEHDLGQVATLTIAHQVAADWRLEHVGSYELVA